VELHFHSLNTPSWRGAQFKHRDNFTLTLPETVTKYKQNQLTNRIRTNKLTPWSRVLLEKLIATQLLKKLPTFYATQRFISVFTRALKWFLSWARYIHFIPPYHMYLRSALMLLSRLRLGFQSGPFPSGFPIKILYLFLISTMPHTSHPSWFDQLNNIWWSLQVMKLIMQNSQPSRHFVPLRSKYSPQNPVLKHNLRSSFSMEGRVSHPYKTTSNIFYTF